MQTKTVVRIGAIAFVAIAITISALQVRMSPGAAELGGTATAPAAGTDPLLPELVRCQSIGAAGATDRDCLRAWAENRRRFLAGGSRPIAALPDERVTGDIAGNEPGAAAPIPAARDATHGGAH
jgi:conjugative transfer region protein TrbK